MPERMWIGPRNWAGGMKRLLNLRLDYYMRRETWVLALFALGLKLGDTTLLSPTLTLSGAHLNSIHGCTLV